MTPVQAGAGIFALALGAILAALAFEHAGGYAPCPLCLQQRYAYYFGVPAIGLALALLANGSAKPAALLFAAVALAFVANAGLGVYQSGAEWGFWPGPETCAGGQAVSTNAGDLLKGLGKLVVRCDEAAWRLFGLSFAGWNAVVSAATAIGGAWLAARLYRK